MQVVYTVTIKKEIPLPDTRHQNIFGGAKVLTPGTRELRIETADIYRERMVQELVKRHYGYFLVKVKTLKGLVD